MKINLKIVFLFLLSLLLTGSCKKKQYPPDVVENDPVYFSSITVEGEKIDIKAGENNYYMYSSAEKDSTGLYNYLAKLQPSGCEICPLGLSIQINNFRLNEGFHQDSSITLRKYDYFSYQKSTAAFVNFYASYSSGAAETDFVWDFGDGQTATGRQVSHFYKTGNTKQICLQVQGSNKCMSAVCNDVAINEGSLRANVVTINTSSRTANFSPVITGGKSPFQYYWDFGDGITDITQSPTHTFPFVGGYAVTLRVKDADNQTVFFKYNYKTLNDLSSCVTNMSVSPTYTSSEQQFASKVRINWTDVSGEKFSTDEQIQGPDSYFEVLSSEDAGLNEKGEKMRKLKVKFGATLFSGNKSVKLQNGEATIAVSYK